MAIKKHVNFFSFCLSLETPNKYIITMCLLCKKEEEKKIKKIGLKVV